MPTHLFSPSREWIFLLVGLGSEGGFGRFSLVERHRYAGCRMGSCWVQPRMLRQECEGVFVALLSLPLVQLGSGRLDVAVDPETSRTWRC
jgi:hypothetical protein